MMTGAKAEPIAGASSIPITKSGPNEIKQSGSSKNSSKQGLTRSMKNLSVSSKSQNTENANGGTATSNSRCTTEKEKGIHDHVEDKLSQLNLAVVGHLPMFVTEFIDHY